MGAEAPAHNMTSDAFWADRHVPEVVPPEGLLYCFYIVY